MWIPVADAILGDIFEIGNVESFWMAYDNLYATLKSEC